MKKSKLSMTFDGPFKIVEKVNNNVYKVKLHEYCNVFATFNVPDLIHYSYEGENLA